VERRLVNDSLVENLGIVFCRFRQGDIKRCSGCRTDIARADVWSDRVQVCAVRRSMALPEKM
jgi:hypothetical protein